MFQATTDYIPLQQKLKNNKHSLFKVTLKWVLGSIVAGVPFMSIWQCTEWARVMKALEQNS